MINSKNFVDATLLSEEYVILTACYSKDVTVPIFNTLSYNFLKQSISKAIFSEGNIKSIHLDMISKNLSSYVSKDNEEEFKVIIDKAGPSLNLKILGSEGVILFDCDFLLAFPLATWPSTAEVSLSIKYLKIQNQKIFIHKRNGRKELAIGQTKTP